MSPLPLMRRASLLAALAALTIGLPARAGAHEPGQPVSAPRAEAAKAAQLTALLTQLDETYARRDDPEKLAAHRSLVAEAEKVSPGEYEVLWRAARLYFWLADAPSIGAKEKSRLGKTCWEYGDRAAAASPGRIEGWYFAAAGVGNYALGIGIITALRKGIEGKFKERLSHAERIDPNYQDGGIQTAWGRFYYELPWPKYDPRKSARSLDAALAKNPYNVRAHVYLAELHRKEKRLDAWRSELEKALAAPPGRYDAPEERRWQEVARRMLADRPRR